MRPMVLAATPLTLHVDDRIAVVAPHPDDDVIGCGALLVAAATAGLATAVVYVTDGARSHPGSREFPPQRLRDVREREAVEALACCGIPATSATFLRVPDGGCESLAAVERARVGASLAETLGAFAPTLVCVPWHRDPHPDHRAVARLAAGVVAARRSSAHRAPRVVAYAVWLDERGTAGDRPTAAEGRPLALAFDTPVALRKRAAIAAHRSQNGALIHDAPDGFALPATMIDRACASPEAYYEIPRG